MFRVIEGGKHHVPTKTGVFQEAERRITMTGYARLAARQTATGAAIPREVRYLPMQIRYAAEVLSALDPIPDDYAHDRYWPAL
jgi:hypothetical protein